MESGAHALGCAVIPAGPGNTEQTLQAIAHLRPDDLLRPARFSQDPARQGGGGRPRRLLDPQGAGFRRGAAREPARRIGAARRQDAAGLRHRRTRRDRLRDRRRGRPAAPGLGVSDAVLVEIVTPGGGRSRRRRQGRRGRGHPPRRQLSAAALRHRRPLGLPARFARRGRGIKGWMGRADQTTKIKGLFVHPSQVVEVGKRHPELGAAADRSPRRRAGRDDPRRRGSSPRRAWRKRSRRRCRASPRCAARGIRRPRRPAQRRQGHRRRTADAIRRPARRDLTPLSASPAPAAPSSPAPPSRRTARRASPSSRRRAPRRRRSSRRGDSSA